MLFENCSYYLNLGFFFLSFLYIYIYIYIYIYFKKLQAKHGCFPYYPFFLEPKAVIKRCKQIGSKFLFAYEKNIKKQRKMIFAKKTSLGG